VIEPATATDLVRTEWTRFVDTLAAAGPEVWERPTRLAGWTVEDLARHVHWGTTLEADGLALAASGSAGPAAGAPLEGPREEIVPALRRAVASLVRCLEALPRPVTGAVPMPYGELPMAMAVDVFVMEAALHGSDLADAVPGQGRGGDSLPPEARGSSATVLQAFWPVLAGAARSTPPVGTTIRLTGPTVRMEATFDGTAWGPAAGEPSVVVEGTDDAVLLYAYGRLPFERADLTVTGDRDLAVRLKEFVPGP
jgi:uncharacterized protein (TIGR03083 family)